MARAHIYLSITETGITSWTGAAASLVADHAFAADDQGLADYIRYVQANTTAVFSLLTDLPDEDCRLELIPHVNARSRGLVTKRRLNQLYRGSAYRTATQQGRETTGRRDDRILYTALTNANVVDRWLGPLVEYDVCIDGLYSVTLLTARHAQVIKAIPERALIVSRQFGSGLRQTYISNGSLRFSRLTPTEDDGIAAVSAQLAAEAARARQFLASLRAIERTEVMQVVLLCGEDEVASFQDACANSELIHYQFVPITSMARSLRVAAEPTLATAESVWMRFIAAHRPLNQYATPPQRKAYLAWRLGRVLLAGAMLFLAAGGGISAWYAAGSYKLKQEAEQLATRKAEAEHIYAANVPNASTEITPTGMKNVVLAYRQLVESRPELAASLAQVSSVLQDFPMAELDEVTWLVSADPNAPMVDAGSSEAQAPAPAPTPSADANGNPVPQGLYVLLRIKGTLPGYDFRYREALSTVDDLADALGKLPGAKVDRLQLPIDVNSLGTIGMSTSSLSEANKGAPFTLKVVLPAKLPQAATTAGGVQ